MNDDDDDDDDNDDDDTLNSVKLREIQNKLLKLQIVLKCNSNVVVIILSILYCCYYHCY